jgi:hypothetical protein
LSAAADRREVGTLISASRCRVEGSPSMVAPLGRSRLFAVNHPSASSGLFLTTSSICRSRSIVCCAMGHTRGATTWIANLVADDKAYRVAFPDGAGFNPGYRVAQWPPSYPGITEDYRRTHHFLEMLKPDIWLAQHNEYYDCQGKRKRAETEGVKAWMDPEGYRRWVASKKRAFEDQVEEELGAPKTTTK